MKEQEATNREMIQAENLAVSEPLEMEVFDVGNHYHVEILMAPPDVIIHLFRYSGAWPKDMKQRIIKEMDAQVSDDYTAAYEQLMDSWFIRIFGFCESRVSPREGAKSLIHEMVRNLVKKEVADGAIRVPGV